jgi:signal transduction histidine kinase
MIQIELLTGAPPYFELPPMPALFRIVQESLTNVVRHAQARAVWLDLVVQDGFLVLTVRDDGCGMGAERGSDGIGLISMRERARMVGGSLELVSSAGAGTSVQVRIALETLAAPSQGAALAQEGAV